MIAVKPLSRSTIDQWPVQESGLPVRVVNSAHSAGITTVGQLRGWSDADLLELKSLGKISLNHIHFFFRICGQIEEGRQKFQSVQEVFEIFLDGPERMVLSARYGLHQSEMKPLRNWVTLQEIGNAEQKTRERVRQVEETAKAQLRSRLASVCLESFYDYFKDFLKTRHYAASTADLTRLQGDPILAGLNPCGLMLLLHDLRPDQYMFYHGFFSLLPQEFLEYLEQWARAYLDQQMQPIRLEAIPTDLFDSAAPEFRPHARHILGVLLDHCAGVAATEDNRYFLFPRGIHGFLRETMQSMDRPAHYRNVSKVFNEKVKSGSRKGAGYILDMLNANPSCVRVDRGTYDLR